jgi:hypothetical protein
MKKLLIGLIGLASLSAFAEVKHIKIDRQFYGEKSYGYIDGQSYHFYCKDEFYGSVIFENPHESNGRSLQAYQVSDEDCSKSLKKVDKAVKEYAEVFLSMNCKNIGTGTHDCTVNL